MIVTLILICLVGAGIAAAIMPRLARSRRRISAVVKAAAIVPGALMLAIAVMIAFAKLQGGQGDMGSIAAAAMILLGSIAAGASFVTGLLAAWARLHYRP